MLKYLTPVQLAERWGGTIHIRTLQNWRCKREGPEFVKIGSRVMYPLEAVEKWERARWGRVGDA